ncbi:hypothetical protein E0Z10_g1271 [Xylaria hypoxylon]|uniref:KAP NTPase domain-containing protein n=1 Tax=Xylaria hypoxylon TaxID=37992 RepID=A0A4Z0YU53_9PEZI|nr:hypothetical protein E0Z10_g1271 [Xylaria hypoxylon]
MLKWYRDEQQNYLEVALKTPTSKPTIIFIDAMGECDDDAVYDLVDYFNRLTKEASQLGAKLNVCLSSRDLSQDIADRSGSVFLWVVLVVSNLKKSARGKSLKWLRNMLDETPRVLADLFRQLFADVDEKDPQRTINLIHLILFAHQPLSRAELHVALGFRLHAYPSILSWKDSVEYRETGKAQHEMIVDFSKGLLEPTPISLMYKAEALMTAPSTAYQFIHETVRGFFLSGEGFNVLKFYTRSVVGSGHDTFAWACARFLDIENASSESFGQYALKRLFYHIEAAVTSGDFGEAVLRYLNARNIISRLHRSEFSSVSRGADLMYGAAEEWKGPFTLS